MTFMGVMELDQEWKGDQNSEKKVYWHVSFSMKLHDNSLSWSNNISCIKLSRYNHSCEEYDSMGEPEPDPFLRICPLGVKSCFYITGKYGNQSKYENNTKYILIFYLL